MIQTQPVEVRVKAEIGKIKEIEGCFEWMREAGFVQSLIDTFLKIRQQSPNSQFSSLQTNLKLISSLLIDDTFKFYDSITARKDVIIRKRSETGSLSKQGGFLDPDNFKLSISPQFNETSSPRTRKSISSHKTLNLKSTHPIKSKNRRPTLSQEKTDSGAKTQMKEKEIMMKNIEEFEISKDKIFKALQDDSLFSLSRDNSKEKSSPHLKSRTQHSHFEELLEDLNKQSLRRIEEEDDKQARVSRNQGTNLKFKTVEDFADPSLSNGGPSQRTLDGCHKKASKSGLTKVALNKAIKNMKHLPQHQQYFAMSHKTPSEGYVYKHSLSRQVLGACQLRPGVKSSKVLGKESASKKRPVVGLKVKNNQNHLISGI